MQNLIGALTSPYGFNIVDALKGTIVYLELVYDTNFHGKDKAKARLWIEVTDDYYNNEGELVEGGKINGYIDMKEIGEIVGLGDYFSYGLVKDVDINNLLSKASGLLGGLTSASGDAYVSADDDDALKSTGILPENIWTIVNAIIGRLLVAEDFVTIGLDENLMNGVIRLLLGEGNEDLVKLVEKLPHLRTTDNRDTSGITINFYGSAPTIDLNFGWVVGKEYNLTLDAYNDKFAYILRSETEAPDGYIAGMCSYLITLLIFPIETETEKMTNTPSHKQNIKLSF